MIRAQHTNFHVWFFRIYSRWMIRHHFSQVIIKGEWADRDLPVVLIGNHFSWWDGFIANYLNNTLFKKVFHVMMLEEELKKRRFLSRAGAFSIDRGKRSVVDSLTYAAEIMHDKKNLLTLYPQGKFQSVHTRPVNFEKGYFTILKKAGESGFQLVFYLALTDYFELRKPKLMIYMKEQSFTRETTAGELEKLYNAFYLDAARQQEELA